MRPLWAFRNLVRFGCNITVVPQNHLAREPPQRAGLIVPPSAAGPSAGGLGVLPPLVLRHRVVRHDLALEHPNLTAVGAVSGLRRRLAVIDTGVQGLPRPGVSA